MAEHSEIDRDGAIAILRLANPPTHALSLGLIARLAEELDTLASDALVKGIVLAGQRGVFASSGDLTELDQAGYGHALRALCQQVEDCPKPVVAALAGGVFGAGLELALAAHARVARTTARFMMSEVRIGLPPCAGATQRLPRLCGSRNALRVLLTARVFTADQNEVEGLVDQHVEPDADCVKAAVALCDAMDAPRPTRARLDGFSDPMGYAAGIAKMRKDPDLAEDPVKAQIVDLVEAANLLPFEAGLAMEAAAYSDALASDRSTALRYAILAERNAWRFDLPDDTPVPAIGTIAVLGGGPFAVQTILAVLHADLRVNWGTRDPAVLAEGLSAVRRTFEAGVKSGGLTRQEADLRLGRLKHGSSAEMVKGADIILHAARGQGAVPADPGILRAVAMPGRVDAIGLRFAMPIVSRRLLEVIHGPDGTPEQVAAGLSLAKRLKKIPVHVRSREHSVADRLLAAQNRASDALLDAGASPYQVDQALQDAGWMVPVFQHRDTLGLTSQAQDGRAEGTVNWAGRMVASGRAGRHEGLGFYIWNGGTATPDVEVTDLLEQARPPADWTDAQLLSLMVGAMANEGARLLRDGTVHKASDIDVVALMALDFPRALGGPMLAVGHMGLFAVKRAMERFDHPDQAFWHPDPLWADLIKNGKGFADLERLA